VRGGGGHWLHCCMPPHTLAAEPRPLYTCRHTHTHTNKHTHAYVQPHMHTSMDTSRNARAGKGCAQTSRTWRQRAGHQERAWTRRPERCRFAARLLAYSADSESNPTAQPRAISAHMAHTRTACSRVTCAACPCAPCAKCTCVAYVACVMPRMRICLSTTEERREACEDAKHASACRCMRALADDTCCWQCCRRRRQRSEGTQRRVTQRPAAPWRCPAPARMLPSE
jgi:hypothetical protein